MHLTYVVAKFDHSKIRSHLATCLENCQITRFPVLGERKSAVRKPNCTAHVVCQKRKVMRWHSVMCVMSSEVFGESDVHWECKRCVHE